MDPAEEINEEDNIRNVQETEIDLSDEQQDWRFLNALSGSNNSTLPKRGEKDFEPDGTGVQDTILAESRNAMFEALSGERKHSGKNHIKAIWFPEFQQAMVDVARGPHFKSIGKADSKGKVWLQPEEIMYLLDRGSMECWWPEGVPMSLQATYATCINVLGGIEKLQVYENLKRNGYLVIRADTYHDDELAAALESITVDDTIEQVEYTRTVTKTRCFSSAFDLLWSEILPSIFRFKQWANGVSPLTPQGPVARRKVYRSFDNVYEDLQIIPCHKPPHTQEVADLQLQSRPLQHQPFSITFNVWKPSPTFRKATPPKPDFAVVVISARDQKMPTLAQTAAILDTRPVELKMKDKSPIMRLKDGWRTVVFAVVDAGIISYMKIGDVGFADEKMYIKPPAKTGPRKPYKKRQQKPKPMQS
ncbi:hypothetical protein NADFUDRAFT_50725 [Nadsonia fulvescens var. elongata DSM 6958]|uniref:tRNA-splicing endonuclease subunit Sen54 N-terminal domain-containing protein n=1 Tax=Nadsonia fulvescens var. elongata DSM 6958 TaxID=857566 RepID=A0A1E3PPH2_9ASCO|nr:hypothetical protein NADFUDRAFT_50725 [Nadsonia fulvescens var. elongata DSM 6958]